MGTSLEPPDPVTPLWSMCGGLGVIRWTAFGRAMCSKSLKQEKTHNCWLLYFLKLKQH